MGQIRENLNKLRKTVLKKLTNSRNSGHLLAVSCSAFGNGVFLTAVEDIYQAGKDEMMIVFKWYDNNSHILSRTHVSIDEIIEVKSVNKNLQESNLKPTMTAA
jgi:hypothetical protein